MRVLNVVSVASAREGGGNAERTVQLTRTLSLAGIDCTLLTLEIGDLAERRAQLGGGRLVALPCINSRFQLPWPCWRTIARLVSQSDVVHLMGYWSLLGLLVFMAARRAGVPYVVSPAGALPLFGRSKLLKRLFNCLAGRSMIRKASGWIAVTRSELPDFAAYGVSQQRVEVIPNGVVEADWACAEGLPFQAIKGLPPAPYILFMGRLNPIKGPDLLVAAFTAIAADYPDIHLVLAGPDEGLQQPLEQAARTSGLADRIHFVGFVSGQEKTLAYHSASLLVIPSRSEAMSLVAVEGGVCGTPVLMTDQCGLDDLREIEPGLVVPADAGALAAGLRLALTDMQRLQRWGEQWHAMVHERFLWQDIGRHFAQYLSTITQQRSD